MLAWGRSMKLKRTSGCVICALLLTACPGPNDGGVDVESAVQNELLSEGANRIVANGGRLPPPSVSIGYRDADSFDLELYSSLRTLNDVRVNFASPQQQVPTRVALWTSAIQRSGGQVATCDISTGAGLGAGTIFALAKLVASWMFGRLQSYLLYRPAGNVSAVIEVDGEDRLARSVRFISRDNFGGVKGSYRKCANG